MTIITLLTDLGTTDAYVGIVKGILYGRSPETHVVDLVHAAEPGSLYASAYLLASAYPYFPAGTVHLVLADPSAAAGRRILAADVAGQFVVAPDNGVAAPLFDQEPPRAIVAVENPEFLLEPRRHTFHARAIYAPAAAALARGIPLDSMGSMFPSPTGLPHGRATRNPDGSVMGEVVHIDHFGNLVTNIEAGLVPDRPRITVGTSVIDGLSTNYGQVDVGKTLAIVGSTGRIEISVNRGHAGKTLFVSRTDPVRIESRA